MAQPTLTRRHALGGLAFAAASLSKAWAQPGGDGAVTFLAVGDWGRNGEFGQQAVADRMGETAREIGAKFVISTGDNFYENGVTGVDDPTWKTSFEDVYAAPSLQIPWYVALGNHDYRGNSEAQIAYSDKSTRWRMPSRWFSFQERAPDGATIEVFVIDTSPLIAGYYKEGSITKVAGQDAEGQLRWLDQKLAASKADWKIVIGHHPLYSGVSPSAAKPPAAISEAGPARAENLLSRIDPILQRYRVPLYMNGHKHHLEHTHRGFTNYVCTGAGSKSGSECSMNGSDFCVAESGFVACAVNRSALRIAYRDYRGAELHVVDIPRPKA